MQVMWFEWVSYESMLKPLFTDEPAWFCCLPQGCTFQRVSPNRCARAHATHVTRVTHLTHVTPGRPRLVCSTPESSTHNSSRSWRGFGIPMRWSSPTAASDR